MDNTSPLILDEAVKKAITESNLYSDRAKTGMLDMVQYLTDSEKEEIITLLNEHSKKERKNFASLHNKIDITFAELNNSKERMTPKSQADINIVKNIYHKLIEMLR